MATTSIYGLISQLIQAATEVGLIEVEDQAYVRNQLLDVLKLDRYEENGIPSSNRDIPSILEKIMDYAVKEHLIDNLFSEKDIFSSKVMNVFVPRPSDVHRIFNETYKSSPEEATNYFYNLSIHSHYIQMDRIKKNIEFQTHTPYGEMDITINLSKPEKDPEQIKRERELKKPELNYPKCLLCRENEGYAGRINHPARSNHRVIPVQLNNEKWFLQYSPYVYYNEHCILLSETHRDMSISEKTFANLLEFVHQFPHYFIGSNADLPIVGGSILSHDHYQGGRHEFAMMRANDVVTFILPSYETVKASIISWPLSVIRLKSEDRNALISLAAYILDMWKTYSDPEAEILAHSGDTPHNTITPIAFRKGDEFVLDLVLRNNRTTEAHPLGLFHPHADVHHIKKENIGLIEVMGLAVLPARLKEELKEVERFLLAEPNKLSEIHLPWAQDLKQLYQERLSEETVSDLLREALGYRFTRILEDAGVFKQTEEGLEAFKRFISVLK